MPTDELDVPDPGRVTPAQDRARFRAGLRVPTSGWCSGWTQANRLHGTDERARQRVPGALTPGLLS